ncbi:MAG: ATP-binding protein [Gemmatimonadetes bacterium]|nr:ATP-binding protein [Gemmatimonadota bacterium]
MPPVVTPSPRPEGGRDAGAVPPAALASRQWCMGSDLHDIEPVVEAIVALCERAGFAPRQCRLNVPVAVTEALSNAILRGNANDGARLVRVLATVRPDRLEVEVGDDGPGFDLDGAHGSPADADWLEREDGRGVFLMRQLMDVVNCAPPSPGCPHRVRLLLYRQ